jgi:hypothetical protein
MNTFLAFASTLLAFASLLSVCRGFFVPSPSARNRPPEFVRTFSQGTCPLYATLSSNKDLLPGIALVDDANQEILEELKSLRQSPYFTLYSVDILASCEYMPQELFECYSETCEVYPVDDDEVCRTNVSSGENTACFPN